ncbi:MAG: hypothetical protein NTW28_04595 [Candidatus Solibacter sp.]|nr:hypothetical protein [Candidatus Solibacter sp.]
MIRRALETLDAEESSTEEERSALDEKIDRALEQVGQLAQWRLETPCRLIVTYRPANLGGVPPRSLAQ